MKIVGFPVSCAVFIGAYVVAIDANALPERSAKEFFKALIESIVD